MASADNPMTKKAGTIRYIDLAYYGRFDQLVRGLIEKEIKGESTNDLMALSERLQEFETNIVDNLKKYRKRIDINAKN